MPRHTEEERRRRRVTSEDVPGSGLARGAAESIEARRRRMKELLDKI